MKATDLIRSVLDIIDGVEQPQEQEQDLAVIDTDFLAAALNEPKEELPTLQHDGDIEGTPCGSGPEPGEQVANRFKTVYDMLAQEKPTAWATSPNPTVADIDAVTVDAGGGHNGPKHVADIRGEHGRLYGDN
jgi:hypothetical protein